MKKIINILVITLGLFTVFTMTSCTKDSSSVNQNDIYINNEIDTLAYVEDNYVREDLTSLGFEGSETTAESTTEVITETIPDETLVETAVTTTETTRSGEVESPSTIYLKLRNEVEALNLRLAAQLTAIGNETQEARRKLNDVTTSGISLSEDDSRLIRRSLNRINDLRNQILETKSVTDQRLQRLNDISASIIRENLPRINRAYTEVINDLKHCMELRVEIRTILENINTILDSYLER